MPRVIDRDTGEVIVTQDAFASIPKPAIFFKTPNNHDTDAESLSTALTCKDPSKTQQQFAKDADINNILRQFMDTSDPNILNPRGLAPTYMDVPETDLQSEIITSWEVNEAWDRLPSKVRKLLNGPQDLVRLIEDAERTGETEELHALGLMKPPPAPPEPPKSATGGTPAPEADKGPAAPAAGPT